MKFKILFITSLVASSFVMAQDKKENIDKDILNWYNSEKTGMRTEKAYKTTLKGKKAKKVVVAIIDSGVDIEHKDLKGKIWKNVDEIPNNGKDDDNNGYIDDVYGWSFLGGKDGENANHAQLEVTRIYARLKKKFEGKSKEDLEGEMRDEYDTYLQVKDVVEKKRESAKARLARYKKLKAELEESGTWAKGTFGDDYDEKDIKKFMKKKSKDDKKKMAKKASMALMYLNKDELYEDLKGAEEYFQGQLDYHYNVDYTEDRDIIGDNPSDITDTDYGNNDVEGPDAGHGTHVAGIVGAIRGNNLGGDGVAEHVELMSVRAVPDGDERDKDIALAIRYAVDNGAQVINMSFGKAYAENQKWVKDAIRYAESKDVLLVHAAGNDNKNTDEKPNFPKPKYEGMDRFSNWLEIGASTRYANAYSVKLPRKPKLFFWKKRVVKKVPSKLAASFSNYGKETVDVFAPGLEIYNTYPQSDYKTLRGTSMASPMVAGVAALIKSYFPSLSMRQIKDIIIESAQPLSREVVKPGSEEELVKFDSLSRRGGVVDVFLAVEIAAKRAS